MASGKTYRRTTSNVSGFVVALALGCIAPLPSLAQGSDREREACTPDAFRLCTMAMPDADRVEDCLRRAGPRLSPACYAVFFPPPPPGALAQPRVRVGPQRPTRERPMQQMPGLPPVGDDDD